MDELTDIEICKRIAEIEGLNFIVVEPLLNKEPRIAIVNQDGSGLPRTYNPLTNKALLLDLIEKHLIYEQGTLGDESLFKFAVYKQGDFTRSALLSIIAKHK